MTLVSQKTNNVLMTTLIAVAAAILVVIVGLITIYFTAPLIVRFGLKPSRSGKVFASYSHKDRRQVELIGQVTKGLGWKFVCDQTDILGGENWQEKVTKLITESDMFQLFWSKNAFESKQVENEWKYALRLKRKRDFIRPVYWEQGLTIPRELSHLQFTFIDLDLNNERASIPPSLSTLRSMPISFILLLLLSLTVIAAVTFWGLRKIIERPYGVTQEQEHLDQKQSQSLSSPTTTTPLGTPSPSPYPSPSPSPLYIRRPSQPTLLAANVLGKLSQDNRPTKRGSQVYFTLVLTNNGGKPARGIKVIFGISQSDIQKSNLIGTGNKSRTRWPQHQFPRPNDSKPELEYWFFCCFPLEPAETIKFQFFGILNRDLLPGETVVTELKDAIYPDRIVYDPPN